MEYTQNYQFRKPIRGVDNADIDDLNYNWDRQDSIDNAFYRNFAQNYDSAETYNTGDVVMYEFLLYKCLEDNVTGSWDETKWERTTAGEAGGSTVEPNPTDPPTEELETLGINDVVYEIVSSKVYGEAEASLITLTDASAAPAEELKVAIEPQQAGTGDPSPENVRPISGWDEVNVTRCGKNLIPYPYSSTTMTLNGITFTDIGDGTIKVDGTATAPTDFYLSADNSLKLPIGSYIITCENFPSNCYFVFGEGGGLPYKNIWGSMMPFSFSVTENSTIKFCRARISSGTTLSNAIIKPMIRLASETATTYEPYQGTTYTIQLGSTCYGGELDVKSGVLKVTDGYIASYNGETLPSTWISDRDVYAPNTSPTTGAEVVYKLATPQEIQLTPTEVTLLLGINNIWADSGDTYIKYKRDLNIFLNELERRIKALEEG